MTKLFSHHRPSEEIDQRSRRRRQLVRSHLELRTRRPRDESGVTLILALVFILAIGLILIALVSATGADLLNANNLTKQRSIEYAADGAVTMAAQSVRYSGNQYLPYPQNPPTDCIPGGGSVKTNGVSIEVDCTQQIYDPGSGVTRVINFYACTSGPCTSTNAILTAQVTYDDWGLDGTTYLCQPGGPTPSRATCGTGMTVNNWILSTATN
jgi:hypothetical protein